MMNEYQEIFRRYEKKFILTDEQFGSFRDMVIGRLEYNKYHKSTICNMYYDTPDFRLIRASAETPVPVYKEKLRLRTYGVPQGGSQAFVELKKKYMGVVYKRRVSLPLNAARTYLAGQTVPPESGQIYREIDYFMKYYDNPKPAMFISYDREAYYDRENSDVRITFDNNITYRTHSLDLESGVFGEKLLPEGRHLMEIKVPEAMPIWLAGVLSELEIRKIRYSKYGNAYKRAAFGGQPVKVSVCRDTEEVNACA